MDHSTKTEDRFPPGRLVATPGVLPVLASAGVSPLVYINRHVRGDWGAPEENDVHENLV